MEKVLLDTDIGGDIDDAICLAYLLKEPQCNLIGITTVCGEPEKRAAVADAICRAAGKQVPIVAGLDTTLQPIPVYPTPDGGRSCLSVPKDKRAPTRDRADRNRKYDKYRYFVHCSPRCRRTSEKTVCYEWLFGQRAAAGSLL